jgi:hypothetical protein
VPRAYILIALLSAAMATSRTAMATQSIDQEAPRPPNLIAPPRVPPATADHPPPEVVLGSVQLVVGYGAEIGGFLGLLEISNFKELGVGDYIVPAFAFAAMPAFAAGVVCGAGTFSRSYDGRCSTTFIGAYAAATLGLVLGFAAAPSPGYDDTNAFMQSMTATIGIALLTPIGAVIGYHAGKREIPRDRPATALSAPLDAGRMFATPVSEPRRAAFAARSPQLLVPVLSASW